MNGQFVFVIGGGDASSAVSWLKGVSDSTPRGERTRIILMAGDAGLIGTTVALNAFGADSRLGDNQRNIFTS